jgi:hypothetical protein
MDEATAAPWSDAENDLLVASYFQMLTLDLRGKPYVKAEFRRSVEARIGRSKGSVEFKNQNVSAVLIGMGQPWIAGYKPASQFQASLVDAVMRWLVANPDWETSAHLLAGHSGRSGMAEAKPLWIGPPPTHRNAPPPVDPERLRLVSQRCNAAERDERNRALGEAGERRVLEHEDLTLRHGGRADLAKLIRWVSKEDGDGAGYDIASFEIDGAPRLIEVKTTNGWERTPFHITANELAVAEAERSSWVLLRLWNFARSPNAFEIRPPLEAHIELTPTSFLAALR